MKNLQLSLKKQWFEMTKAGIKTEDYREVTDYWCKRLIDNITLFGASDCAIKNIPYRELPNGVNFNGISLNAIKRDVVFREFTANIMTLGYPKSTDTERILKLEHKGIEIGYGDPEWGAEPNKLYFIIKHGQLL